jgi:hypothetical protein
MVPVPALPLAAFVLMMVLASAVALTTLLLAVTRVGALSMLREA